MGAVSLHPKALLVPVREIIPGRMATMAAAVSGRPCWIPGVCFGMGSYLHKTYADAVYPIGAQCRSSELAG